MYSEHKTPTPFQDEDKWFRLTKRQIAFLLVAGALSIAVCNLCHVLHVLPLGIILSTVFVSVALSFGFLKIPEEKYLFGGGKKIEVIVFCLLVKKMKGVIYTRNMNDDEKEEEQ